MGWRNEKGRLQVLYHLVSSWASEVPRKQGSEVPSLKATEKACFFTLQIRGQGLRGGSAVIPRYHSLSHWCI